MIRPKKNKSASIMLGKISLALALIVGTFPSVTAVADVPLSGCAAGGTCVTFESGDTSGFNLIPFEGLVTAAVDDAPAGGSAGSSKAAKLVKSSASMLWAGATFYTRPAGESFLTDASQVITANVYAPDAGRTLMLKVENPGGISIERSITTTQAGWQSVTFDFSSSYTVGGVYRAASLFPDFMSEQNSTWYVDDVRFPATQALSGCAAGGTCVTFESSDTTGFNLIPFEGLVSATVENAPAGGSIGSTKAAQLVKSSASMLWAGATFYTRPAGESFLTDASQVITANVYAPDAGRTLMLKVEGPGVAIERSITTTQAGWQSVTFDFSSSYTVGGVYRAASLFPDFMSEQNSTWYVDDVRFPAIQLGEPLPGCAADGTCLTFEASDTSGFNLVGFEGLVSATVENAPSGGSVGSTKAAQLVKSTSSMLWAGASFYTRPAGESFLTDASQVITANVYAPDAGRTLMLKVENPGGIAMERSITTTKSGWQSVTFDFSSSYISGGVYRMASLFPDFMDAQNSTWYVDDVRFPAALPLAGCAAGGTCITFEAGDTTGFSFITFEGLVSAGVDDAPAGGSVGSIKSGKLVKSTAGQPWAGATFYSRPLTESFLTDGSQIVTANIYAPAAGRTLMLKVEGPSVAIERSITTTKSGWQSVSFDYSSSYATGGKYRLASFFPDFLDAQNSTWYVDDVRFPGTAKTPEEIAAEEAARAAAAAAEIASAWATYKAKPSYYDPQSPASASLDLAAKTVTCSSPSAAATPTYAAYYLFVNRQLVAAKRSGAFAEAPRYPEINAAVDGLTTVKSATFALDPAWNANGNSATLRCDIQVGTELNSKVLSTPTLRLQGVGKFIRKTKSTSTVAPSAVTMRLVTPVMVKDGDGKPVDYVDFKNSPKDDNWAQYYGNADGGLGVFYRYLTAGATLNLKYLVTDSDTKKPLANFPVWLMVNKNYGGIQRASWNFENNGLVNAAKASVQDIGETQFAGKTDAYGYVSFTLVNTTSAADAEPTPATLNAIQPASVGAGVQSTITLTARLSGGEVKETKDFLWIHIVKP